MNKYIKFASLLFVTFLSFVKIDLFGQCTAVIGINNSVQEIGDTVSGCDPFNILFTDNSTGGTITRTWTFGDGTANSTANSVTHPFVSGIKTDTMYIVTLTATCLNNSTKSTTLKVKVLRRPNVSFTANKLTACQQTELVTFNNTSENKVGYTHLWDFAGDGSSSLISPTYTFQNDGKKTIKLTVTDDRLCFRTLSKTDYINVVKLPSPDFSLGGPQSGCNPMTVTLLNTTADADITSWSWDFGDGSPKVSAKDLTSSHIYNTTATTLFTAKLTAVNSLGCSNTTNKSILDQFTPSAKFSSPVNICRNSETSISYTGSANSSTKYTWKFDTDIIQISGSKSGPYNLKFPKVGFPTIKLTTKDTLTGCEDTLKKSVEVKDVPELFLASSSGDTICEASLVTFTATPAIYSNYVFKINKTQVQSSADNSFIAPLTLKTKDTVSVEIDNGCGGVENIPVIVTVKELPQVTLKSSRDTIYKKTVVIFTAVPKDTNGYEKYEFYEGNVLKQSGSKNVWITDSLVDGKLVNVIAFNKGCTGNVSNKVIKVLDPFVSPDVTAKTSTSSITINWTKVLNDIGKSPDGYQISINGGPFIDPSIGYGPNGTTHIMNGLNPGDSIKITVRTLATKLNNADTLGNSVINQTYTFFARDCDPVTFLAGPDVSVCQGDSVTLHVKSVSCAKYSVNWGGMANTQLNSYTFLPSKSLTVKIGIVDSNQTNCPFEKFTEIEVKAKPSITISVSPQSELIKGDFVKYTASPGSYDSYAFFNKGIQVQKSSVNLYATKEYASGDIITANAELNGCISDISNAIILKIDNSVNPVQINLDTATTSSVVINWAPVEGATGYLVSVNGQSYVVPNGASVNNTIDHLVSGLTPGQKVDVLVKSFNSTDTTISSLFTTYALSCRGLSVDLIGSENSCSGDSAYVSISNILPSYITIKWQNDVAGINKTYSFVPLTTTNIKLELADSERAGCIVSRNYLVEIDYSSKCNKTDFSKLDQAQINLDTATTQSVTIHWDVVKDATGYLVSVNGQTYIVPNGENDGTQLTHLISGLSPGDLVNVVVKSFNAVDTSISSIFTTSALSCRGVDINLAGTSIICSNDSAAVQILSSLPSYYQTKWESNVFGKSLIYKLKPTITTDVKLEVVDIERAGCSIVRYYKVIVDNSLNCKNESNNPNTEIVIKDKLTPPDVSIDTATNTTIKIAWKPVEGATGYSISFDGNTYVYFDGSLIPDKNGNLTYTQTGLIPNETVTYVVKAFNGIDTVTSVIINGVATNCSALAYTIESNSPICFGDSAVVSITSILPANYQIKWANSVVGSSREYRFKPSVTTLLNVTVTNPSQPLCGLTKNILVKVNPIPVVTLNSSDLNDTIYKGTPISFTATPSGLDGYEFYERFSIVQNSSLSVFNTNTLEDNRKITVIGVKDGCRSLASNAIITKVKDPLGNIQISGTSTTNSLEITWSKVPDAVRYEVSVNGNPFVSPSSGNKSTDTTHKITGLSPDVETVIIVKAYTSDPQGFGSSTSDPWIQTTIICNAITFKVSSDTTICEGNKANLKLLKTNVLKYSLRWNYSLPSNATTFAISPSETVNVPVQLIDSSQINCPYYRTLKVSVNERNPMSLFAADSSYQICQGALFTVNAQPSNLDNYLFKRGNTVLQNSGNPSLLVTTFSKGDTITVTGTSNSCSALNDAKYAKKVNPIPSSVIDAPISNNACQGQDVIYTGIPLKNSARFTFFENGILAQSSGSSSYIKSNVSVGVLPAVSLIVKDIKTGCTSLLSSPKIVTILPFTSVTVGSNITGNIVCEGLPISFTITPNTLSKYKFYVNDILKQDSVSNVFTKRNLVNGDKVKVIGVNASNCESPTTADIVVTIKPVAKPVIVADTLTVCDGTLAHIKATIDATLSPTLKWNTGEIVDSISKVYTADQWQKITSTLNSCPASDSIFIKVDKEVPPIAVITELSGHLKANITEVCKGESTSFKGSGSISKFAKYKWTDNTGLVLSNTADVDITPSQSSVYNLIVLNLACSDTAQVSIDLVSCGIATQIITPGGDGKNDKWIALEAKDYFKGNSLTIFNRWGNEVFNFVNYKNEWEGTNNDGEKLPEGTYYYVLKIDGDASARVGYIMIKR